ncbi:hypothetical protein SAY86_012732 [Trapa natans]|uniref:Citrate transporter-like domain-containing protein n=1 Tax=Trapa natans TaxID=22666 RepID=A0AAN7MD66_TRANT|nr:hypothetical protein SAY86_012732 [Trapa natans]
MASSTPEVVLGSVAFSIFWVMAVFPSVPLLPVGRTAGSLLGGTLMVIFQVSTPDQAYASIDLQVLGLLFGTMVVSIYLERADLFKYLGKLLSWRSKGAKDLLCRVCLISAISSALFTNDTSCVVLTEFVLKIARQHDLPPRPFLLALASGANIGSSATPIGNPQNLVIAVQSKISFGVFLLGLFPAMIVGVVVNALILLAMYWRVLSVHKVDQEAAMDVISEEDASSHRFSPAMMSHHSPAQEWTTGLDSSPTSIHSSTIHANGNEVHMASSSPRSNGHKEDDTASAIATPWNGVSSVEMGTGEGTGREANSSKKRKRTIWKSCVYLVTVGMLVSFLMGLNMSWTAITAAVALIVLDFKDAGSCLEKVSYFLLIFFSGMFITVDGFNRTGIPGKFWDLMEPHTKIDHPSGIAVLAIVILLLSNLASNVPTVLLLGGRVAASAAAISSAEVKKSWLILAWASTVGGNLSLLGSAANLIVCEQARRATGLEYTLSFWGHLMFGVPSTIIVTAIGLTLIR